MMDFEQQQQQQERMHANNKVEAKPFDLLRARG
jgi:hypothetical protein